MNQINATNSALSVMAGVALGGIAYTISRSKLFGCAALVVPPAAYALASVLSTRNREGGEATSVEEPTFESFVTAAPRETVEGELAWVRGLGIKNAERETRLRELLDANDLGHEFNNLHLELLVDGARAADWEGARECEIRVVARTVLSDSKIVLFKELRIRDERVSVNTLGAITREELRVLLANLSSPTVAQAKMRSEFRSIVWERAAAGIAIPEEVVVETVSFLQEAMALEPTSREVRLPGANASRSTTPWPRLLISLASDAKNETCFARGFLEFRSTLLATKLRHRGYDVQYHYYGDMVDNRHLMQFTVTDRSGQQSKHDLDVQDHLAPNLLRDVLEQHPPL